MRDPFCRYNDRANKLFNPIKQYLCRGFSTILEMHFTDFRKNELVAKNEVELKAMLSLSDGM